MSPYHIALYLYHSVPNMNFLFLSEGVLVVLGSEYLVDFNNSVNFEALPHKTEFFSDFNHSIIAFQNFD